MAAVKQSPAPAAPQTSQASQGQSPAQPNAVVPPPGAGFRTAPEPPPPLKSNPVKEAAERQRAALERLTGGGDEDADVAEETPPKVTPSGKQKPPADSGADGKPAAEETPEGQDADEKSARKAPQPRYDSDSFKTWARNHPEEASKLAREFFRTNADHDAWTTHFVKYQTKERKRHESEAKSKQELVAAAEAVKKHAKETEERDKPIYDLVNAGRAAAAAIKANKPETADYEAIDMVFEHAFGVNFDDYARHRARRGMAISPEMKALRLENDRLKRESEAKGKAETPPPAETKAAEPENLEWLEGEVDAEHAVREVSNWQSKVQKLLNESRDEEGDETITVEDAAEQVLAAARAKLTGDKAPKTGKGKPAPPARTGKPPRRARDDDDDEPAPRGGRHGLSDGEHAYLTGPAPKNINERIQWATKRARAGIT